jgi:membrane protease YdiL (CAAX protease family)
MYPQIILKFIHHWKKELVALLIAFLGLFLALFFPAQGDFQFVSRIVLFLIVLPTIFIKWTLRKDLSDFGFNLDNKTIGFIWAGIMLLVSFLIVLILFYFFKLETRYILPAAIVTDFWSFAFYEIILINGIVFILEFFFRGFLQTVLREKLGFFSIFIQFITFLLFLFFIHKLTWQYTPLIILSLASGVVAHKSRSFVYSYFMSLIFTIFLDLYVIELFK